MRDLTAGVCALYLVILAGWGALKALAILAESLDTNNTLFSLTLLALGAFCYLWLWSKEVM